ncbi:MAG TPA: hypothetical protein VE733_26835 [Streptosporangiaceae bacterium]|nr:hypothetical protein [Streptosporangiaceae bacterium]
MTEARAWSVEHRTVVLGIPERAGVVFREGTAQVAGLEAVWELHGA